jgi:hypothetical protein
VGHVRIGAKRSRFDERRLRSPRRCQPDACHLRPAWTAFRAHAAVSAARNPREILAVPWWFRAPVRLRQAAFRGCPRLVADDCDAILDAAADEP